MAADLIELFAKGGYEYEDESIEALNIHANETGFVYAFGTEHFLNEHIALLLEYEGSSVKGLRGNSVFADVVYDF